MHTACRWIKFASSTRIRGHSFISMFATALMIGICIIQLNAEEQPFSKSAQNSAKRPVTVRDAVEMTQFGDEGYIRGLSAKHSVAKFSPNGKQFLLMVKRGNLKRNTNDYTLLLFQTDQAVHSASPEVLLEFSSSSTRPAIQQLNWIDNENVSFLGEHPGELQQIYEVNCKTKKLTRLTDSHTSIVSYQMTDIDDRIFFLAEHPVKSLLDDKSGREGIVVTTENLSDLISGKSRFWAGIDFDLFMEKKGRRDRPLSVLTKGAHPRASMWIAPNGKYLVIETMATTFPTAWQDYDDRLLKMTGHRDHADTSPNFVFQYELVDTNTGQSHILLDAPLGSGHSDVAWAPDSNSVVICGSYLPLSVPDPAERKIRQSNRYVAEVKVPDGDVIPITPGEFKFRKWDQRTNKIILESTARRSTVDLEGDLVGYQYTTSGWKRVEAATAELSPSDQIDVSLEEAANAPPNIFVKDLSTGRTSLLMDLNPQFKNFVFAQVEAVKFTAKDGHEVKGGLYRPPGFIPGNRYPLVIQTHGWNPERFWIDGPYSTAFAAQPLACLGIVVLQLEEDSSRSSTPNENREEMAAYEGAIDYLDEMGLIDRSRVGVIGFSRTGLHVKYVLTHSRYKFVAATVADGSDGGYFSYLGPLNSYPGASNDSEVVNGGIPFGAGLTHWIENSPGFSLDKVLTPMRLEANSPASLLYCWEWFVGLRRLGKPVDLVYMPDADHVLVKPWDRMVSQQGNVDWFCFWLKGEEYPDPAKTDQYARWRRLRTLQDENPSASTPSVSQ
jgi:dipeptidyl aminopeptidase/acylaminoacyl peptidase